MGQLLVLLVISPIEIETKIKGDDPAVTKLIAQFGQLLSTVFVERWLRNETGQLWLQLNESMTNETR